MAKEVRKAIMDEGVFEAREVDIRAVVVRWDSLENRPVLNLGSVSPHEAYAWLQSAADRCWSLIDYAECGVEED